MTKPDVREWAMTMMLVARALERIGDNTIDIGEQVAFVVTGLFREFEEDASHPGQPDASLQLGTHHQECSARRREVFLAWWASMRPSTSSSTRRPRDVRTLVEHHALGPLGHRRVGHLGAVADALADE